jgi:hypothetical protein
VSTAVAIATPALGIGGVTSMFSVADAVLLRPLPFANPDRLVVISQSNIQQNQAVLEVTYPAFREWRQHAQALTPLAAIATVNARLVFGRTAEPVRVEGRVVSGEFFAVFGVAPLLGRTRFDARPDVIGQTVTLTGRSYAVVGVANFRINDVVVRRDGSAENVAAAVRALVQDVDARVPAPSIVLMTEVVAGVLAPSLFTARLSGALGIGALLLAALGLYALIDYSVSRGIAEIGLRVTLGAQPTHVRWLVLRRGQQPPKAQCLAYIKEVWTDMRPLSLRKQMEADGDWAPS